MIMTKEHKEAWEDSKLKTLSLYEDIFTPNNKSKTFIELYDLEIKLKKAIKDILEEIEDAQEDCGNLDWISKDQAIKIIKQGVGGKLLKDE